MKGGRASKGAGDIYRSRTLQQTPTYHDATRVGHCAAVKCLLQGSHSEFIQVQVIQGRLYDRLNGVTGWVEGKGIGIHAWNAAGAGGAWGGCSQTGGDTRGDAGCQWAPHWENAQDVLFGL